MIIDLKVNVDKSGIILDEKALYQPNENVKFRTGQVMKDFGIANELRNRPYREFNDMSLIHRMNLDQMSFNQYVEEESQDPSESWRSRAFRPIVRNKVISIAAHVTAAIIYPKIYARDPNDREDKLAAMVMRDLVEYALDSSNGGQGYDRTFISAVISALVNPATFLLEEYAERMREVKEKLANGKIITKEILDEIYSGFMNAVVPCDEVWLGNFYERDVQKQPFVIRRRAIDYSAAEAMYHDREEWKYIKPGLQFLYSDDRNIFYQQYDDTLQGRLVEEVTYWNPRADLELHFVNGVLMDDPDEPNPRQDKRIPLAVAGYEPIDEKFFYYKSLVFKLGPDEEVINTAYRMLADGSYLAAFPPAVAMGTGMITTSVMVPGAVTVLADSPNQASFQTLQTNNNLTALYNLLSKVESSVSESSQDALQSGQASAGSATAFEISRIEQNARVMLGLFAKMVGFMVHDFGNLVVTDILQYLTVGDMMDLENPSKGMKFRSFLIPDRKVNGRSKSRHIAFDAELPEGEVSPEEQLKISFETQRREMKLGKDTQLLRVNPALFRKMKFAVTVQAEAMTPKSDGLIKAQKLEAYALAVQNPLLDPEEVTRTLLLDAFDTTKDDPERFFKEKDVNEMLNLPQESGAPQRPPQPQAPEGVAGAAQSMRQEELTPDSQGAAKQMI